MLNMMYDTPHNGLSILVAWVSKCTMRDEGAKEQKETIREFCSLRRNEVFKISKYVLLTEL